MFSMFLIPVLVALPAAVVFHMTPGTHPQHVFGVPVASGFRQSADARAILRAFFLLNILAAVASAGIGCAGFLWRDARLVIAGPLLQMGVATAIYLYGKARVERFAVEPRSSVRRASLRPEPVIEWWGWVLLMLPVLILAGTAAYLTQNWDQIPARFPVHWGATGLPDRWNDKSLKSVYGVLIIGLSTLVLLYSTAALTALGAPRSGPAMTRLVRTTLHFLAGSGVAVAVLMSAIALQPLSSNPEQPFNPLWVVVPAIAGAIGGAIVIGRISGEAEAEGAASEQGWLWSSLYFNRQDPAMMVRRRIGFGFTPNFGHPVVMWTVPVMMAQLFGVIYYVTH